MVTPVDYARTADVVALGVFDHDALASAIATDGSGVLSDVHTRIAALALPAMIAVAFSSEVIYAYPPRLRRQLAKLGCNRCAALLRFAHVQSRPPTVATVRALVGNLMMLDVGFFGLPPIKDRTVPAAAWCKLLPLLANVELITLAVDMSENGFAAKLGVYTDVCHTILRSAHLCNHRIEWMRRADAAERRGAVQAAVGIVHV
jgi:hypothetical protein